MKFSIIAERVDLDGFPEQFNISYDNKSTDQFENFLFFDTKEEAEEWIKSEEAKEWKDCSFTICEEEESGEGED